MDERHVPFRGLGTLGSGWQRQIWLGESPCHVSMLDGAGFLARPGVDSRRNCSLGGSPSTFEEGLCGHFSVACVVPLQESLSGGEGSEDWLLSAFTGLLRSVVMIFALLTKSGVAAHRSANASFDKANGRGRTRWNDIDVKSRKTLMEA